MPRSTERDAPDWFWVVLGFVLARVAPVSPETVVPLSELRRAVPYASLPPSAEDRSFPSARTLRQVSGVGQLRALAIVRERWRAERAGQEFDVQAVRGIGPVLSAQLTAWSDSEGLQE